MITWGKSFVRDGWSWLRSANNNNSNNANVLGAGGVNSNNNVSNTNAVRPALHSPTLQKMRQ